MKKIYAFLLAMVFTLPSVYLTSCSVEEEEEGELQPGESQPHVIHTWLPDSGETNHAPADARGITQIEVDCEEERPDAP